jgi:hypothetical protein
MTTTPSQPGQQPESQGEYTSPSKKGALAAILATAPAAIVRTAVAAPIKTAEGFTESYLEHDLRPSAGRPAFDSGKALKAAARRSVSSNLSAGAIGLVTLPLYAKAVKQMSSEDPDERRAGVQLMVAQGALFTGIKSVGESIGEVRRGAGAKVIGKKVGGKLLAAGLVGIPANTLIAHSLAKSRRQAASENREVGHKDLLRPALTAGAIGGAGGAVEAVVSHLSSVPAGKRAREAKRLIGAAGLRVVAPKALAYGAAGVASGVLGGYVADKAIKALGK